MKAPAFKWAGPILLLLSAIFLALTGHHWRVVASHQVDKLVRAGDSQRSNNPKLAISYYRAAAMAPGHRFVASHRLADTYLEQSRGDLAAIALGRLPITQGGLRRAQVQLDSGQIQPANWTIDSVLNAASSPDALIVKSQVLMEQGKLLDAIAKLQPLIDQPSARRADLEQYALALAAGERAADLTTLANAQLPELKSLFLAWQSPNPVSESLYQRHLLISAKRVLERPGNNSTAKYRLLAEIELAPINPDKAHLTKAADLLGQGIALNPADIGLRQRRREILMRLGDRAGADHETKLIEQLQSGKI